MADNRLTDSQLQQYHEDGYLLVRQMFDSEEIGMLGRVAREDRILDENAADRQDGEGGSVRLSLWNHPGDGIYGMFARCERMTNAAEQILNDEAYHYHSKMIMKDARVGGAWTWHQDYGYWYQNGVLTPNLVSVFIAVDAATKENGCLQVIKRSHHCGRVDHALRGDQAGAEMERVSEILKRNELIHVEMNPGDGLFFHPNLLHRSDQNLSEHARWSMICCYNARSNDPCKDSHHPRYTPLKKVSDDAIKAVGLKQFDPDQAKAGWLDPETDSSATSLKS